MKWSTFLKTNKLNDKTIKHPHRLFCLFFSPPLRYMYLLGDAPPLPLILIFHLAFLFRNLCCSGEFKAKKNKPRGQHWANNGSALPFIGCRQVEFDLER